LESYSKKKDFGVGKELAGNDRERGTRSLGDRRQVGGGDAGKSGDSGGGPPTGHIGAAREVPGYPALTLLSAARVKADHPDFSLYF
jgi:hypothetical protein